ncbi:MAG: hypothetical protein QG623_650 [Patescibacteria group bacterium]|nr:hypothetical protein [Patescibacteria group bacterium]
MNILFLAIGSISIVLAGLNLRSLGNSVIFSVSVMGHHSDLRKLLANIVVFWLGTIFIVAPVLYSGWEASSYLVNLSGTELKLAAYVFSSFSMVWGLFNLYVYKVGPRRDSEGRLRTKIIVLSRSAGHFQKDFVFGLLNGLSVIFSEIGLFLGGIWLIQKGGGFGYMELVLVLLAATSVVWWIFLSLIYGLNLSDVERFRKSHGSKVSFICGLLGVSGSWLILANSIGIF